MIKDLIGAMEEEKRYVEDRMHSINANLAERLLPFGYENLTEYFSDKKNYEISQWNPEVYYIDVRALTTDLENAIRNEKYGIYISTADYLYAFHGSDEIDYDLCKEYNVSVAELYYDGGTIIGSEKDLGIEIVAPDSIGLEAIAIISKIHEIIVKYFPNAIISGNDILIDGKKVMGSMYRKVGKVFVWAAQISFGDYSELIEKICNKKSTKQPGYIDSTVLSKSVLESEVLSWLQKH